MSILCILSFLNSLFLFLRPQSTAVLKPALQSNGDSITVPTMIRHGISALAIVVAIGCGSPTGLDSDSSIDGQLRNPDGGVDGTFDPNDSDGDGISNAEELVYGSDCRVSDPLVADTDLDGLSDQYDPFPRDPCPEFLLYPSDQGTIWSHTSIRDGTFNDRIEIATPIDGAYTDISIADFDGDGVMDFVATAVEGGQRTLYYFYQEIIIRNEGCQRWQQVALGQVPRGMSGAVADVNNDYLPDLVVRYMVRPGEIESAELVSYINRGNIREAGCAVGTGCAFRQVNAANLTAIAAGQWDLQGAQEAVDVDGDGYLDVVVGTQSLGASVDSPIYLLKGRGDGTFTPPSLLFVHNEGRHHSTANAIIFGDFNRDGRGDLIVGLDDDGDAGGAWFYAGRGDGTFDHYTDGFEAFDLNPNQEDTSNAIGRTSKAKPFDFDFDGRLDIVVGWAPTTSWGPPTRVDILRGDGTGNFAAPQAVSPLIGSQAGFRAQVPQRLCPWFEL